MRNALAHVPKGQQQMVAPVIRTASVQPTCFETTFLMTAGGPANRTPVMGLYIYRRMAGLTYGRAAATGVLIILLGIVVLSALQRVFGKADAVEDAGQ